MISFIFVLIKQSNSFVFSHFLLCISVSVISCLKLFCFPPSVPSRPPSASLPVPPSHISLNGLAESYTAGFRLSQRFSTYWMLLREKCQKSLQILKAILKCVNMNTLTHRIILRLTASKRIFPLSSTDISHRIFKCLSAVSRLYLAKSLDKLPSCILSYSVQASYQTVG